MPKEVSRTPEQIKEAIAEKSLEVKEASTRLSDCITAFQQWLGKLPGRVEAFHSLFHPDAASPDDDLKLSLRLHRSGKEWIISYTSYHAAAVEDFDPVDWKPLTEAPVRIKLAAIQAFPDLFVAIEESQTRMTKKITEACDDFEVWAAKLGFDAKEGK